jgi:AMP phosphorylase
MKLRVKLLEWSTGFPVVMLNEKTADKLGAHLQERILIETLSGKKEKLFTIIDTVDSLVNEKEIAVSSELKHRLNLKKNQIIEINLADPAKSVDYINKKLNNKTLSSREISSIIKDITNNSLSEAEIALFVSAMYKQGMNKKELVYLIKAILKSGNKLNLNNKFLVDKHSIGGIAGNRTTPIVVSICAAEGLIFPKTSSRAITSAAGTADVIEAIARVDFTMKELKKIIKKTNACMVWGGALDMVPADSKIIHVEKLLKIDPESQLLASIISKKLAVGSKYILIDIPYGEGAKVSKKQAERLKRQFEWLGKQFKKKLKCVLTDGRYPIGNGVGPSLELNDVIAILDPEKKGPRDLEDKSLFLAGQILELTGKEKKGKGVLKAMEILDSGKAFEKFKEIINAQEGDINKIPKAKYKKDLYLRKSGKVKDIDNKMINDLARNAGCPIDKAAGVYLHVKVGSELRKNDKIMTLYALSRSRLRRAIKFARKNRPIKLE